MDENDAGMGTVTINIPSQFKNSNIIESKSESSSHQTSKRVRTNNPTSGVGSPSDSIDLTDLSQNPTTTVTKLARATNPNFLTLETIKQRDSTRMIDDNKVLIKAIQTPPPARLGSQVNLIK